MSSVFTPNFLKNKPPIALFLLFLLIVTTTMFSFTFYIKNTDKIINNDIKQNWISLTQHLNTLNLCATNITTAIIEEVTFTTTVTLNITNATQIEAYYNLESWQPICGQLAQTIKVTVIPRNETSCAVITGPAGILPDSNETCTESDTNSTVMLYESCGGTPDSVKLKFEENDFVVYLSEGDKRVIFVHLIWISFILLFFVLIVVVFATFDGYQLTD